MKRTQFFIGLTRNIPIRGEFGLLNKTRRYMIYLVVTIGFAVLGNFTNLLLPSYFWGLTYGTLGIILSLIMEMYIELATKEELPVQVILREDEMKRTLREMREDPSCISIQALWCTRYGGEPEYYAEERTILQRNPRLHIQRLINPTRVEKNTYEDHIESRKPLLDQEKYEVRKTDIEEFECLMCEYEKVSGRETKVFFLFNDLAGNKPGMGIVLDPTKHEKVRFAERAIASWFKREWLTRAQETSLGKNGA